MASLREVWRKCYMSWLLSCYWFSKIILYIKVNAHSLGKIKFSLRFNYLSYSKLGLQWGGLQWDRFYLWNFWVSTTVYLLMSASAFVNCFFHEIFS